MRPSAHTLRKTKKIKQINNKNVQGHHNNGQHLSKKTKKIRENDQNVEDQFDQVHDDESIDEDREIDWRQQNEQENLQQNEQNNDDQLNDKSRQQDDNSEHQQQQQQQQGHEQINEIDGLIAENEKNLQQYQQEVGNRGVVYMSRIPPYMTPNYVRKLLQDSDVERIYLLPQSQWTRNNRIKHGGNKRICFREGWIQFSDKKQAKRVALTLNGQKMVHKKGSFYSEDMWTLKYLPKFKWHHLTQKLAHEQKVKKQKLRLEMDQQRKLQQYYTSQVSKSKIIGGIIRSKQNKGKQIKKSMGRSFNQKSAIEEEMD